MSHRVRIAACTILMTACCAGVVFSQIEGDSGKEFNQAFYKELQISEDDIMQFGESLKPMYEDMQKNIQAKAMAEIPKRMADSSEPMTPESAMRFGMEIAMDELVGMQQPINDQAREFFSEEKRQKMHLRLFQLKEGLIDQLGSSDNPDITQGAFGFEVIQLMGGQPDFLELSPEQSDLITKQQKETSGEAMTLITQAQMKVFMSDPAKLGEIQRLGKEFAEAQTDEERTEIAKKIQAVQGDIFKDLAPQLKTILLKGHENFMRTLTDAQRAKIKSVMAEMPDYMKKLLAEANKDGAGISGLESWVPGMGAPGVPNPRREAPRQRPRGGRTFPGE